MSEFAVRDHTRLKLIRGEATAERFENLNYFLITHAFTFFESPRLSHYPGKYRMELGFFRRAMQQVRFDLSSPEGNLYNTWQKLSIADTFRKGSEATPLQQDQVTDLLVYGDPAAYAVDKLREIRERDFTYIVVERGRKAISERAFEIILASVHSNEPFKPSDT